MNDSARRDTVLRYSAGVRTNHWLVALSFVLAALSGLALFHPALFWLSGNPSSAALSDAHPASLHRPFHGARVPDARRNRVGR